MPQLGRARAVRAGRNRGSRPRNYLARLSGQAVHGAERCVKNIWWEAARLRVTPSVGASRVLASGRPSELASVRRGRSVCWCWVRRLSQTLHRGRFRHDHRDRSMRRSARRRSRRRWRGATRVRHSRLRDCRRLRLRARCRSTAAYGRLGWCNPGDSGLDVISLNNDGGRGEEGSFRSGVHGRQRNLR